MEDFKTLEEQFKDKIDKEKKSDASFQQGEHLTDEQRFRNTVDNMTGKAMISMAVNINEVSSWRQIIGKEPTEENIRWYLTNKIGRRAKIEGNLI